MFCAVKSIFHNDKLQKLLVCLFIVLFFEQIGVINLKRVIVTGAAGFVGQYLCRDLLSRDIEVIGVDISKEKLNALSDDPRFIPVVADFSKYDSLHECIRYNDIDVFYHLAWNGANSAAFRNAELQLSNSIYSVKALDAAIALKCKKFVFAGSYYEYESQKLFSMDEFQPRYSNIYGASKFVTDLVLCKKSKLEGILYSSALLPAVYGEGLSSPTMVKVLLSNFAEGKPSKLVAGDNPYDLIYVGDVARAFFYIGERGKDMARYYVGHRMIDTFKENITRIRDLLSPNSELLFGEYHETQNLDYSLIDTEKLFNDTGFECKADFNTTIQRTYEWIKNRGKL